VNFPKALRRQRGKADGQCKHAQRSQVRLGAAAAAEAAAAQRLQ